MPSDESELHVPSVLLGILRHGPSDPEVEFDDFASVIHARPAPADEESGPAAGVRLITCGGAWSALLVLAPEAAAELATRLAWAVGAASTGGLASRRETMKRTSRGSPDSG